MGLLPKWGLFSGKDKSHGGGPGKMSWGKRGSQMQIKISGLYPIRGSSLKPKPDMIKDSVKKATRVTSVDRLEG